MTSLIMEEVAEDTVEDALVLVVTAGDVMVGVTIGISYLDATSLRLAMKGPKLNRVGSKKELYVKSHTGKMILASILN